MAEGSGLKREVGAQDGENAREAKTPGLGGLAAVELTHTGRADMGGEFDGGGELSGKGVELLAGVGARAGESWGGVAGMRLPQSFGELAKLADTLGVRVADDAGGEGGADGA